MKRILSFTLSLFLVLSLLMYPNYEVQAANVSLSVSASTVNIGDAVKVTVSVPDGVAATIDLSYSSDVLSFSSSSVEVGNNGGTVTINIGKDTPANTNSITITFKANTSGTANLSTNVISAIDMNSANLDEISLGNASTKITVANQTSAPEGNGGGGSSEPQKSADNSLSSLKLSAGSLSPSFKPNTTKYTASVDYSVTKVVVSAKTSNANAVIESVTGDGTVNLEVGKNTIEVIVRAENGVKAKYTIVVTRKTEAESEPQPSESESESEAPVVNEVLQWNGEQLQATEEIPEESIPADFEMTSLVVNGQQMPGLSFGKGDLKVVYLNNTNGAGSLYVYDEEQQTIYPFIKIQSEKSYVMVLLPNEQKDPAPEGFENCTLSIEGKGLISAYQLKGESVENPEGTEEIEDSTSAWNLFGAETFYAAEPKESEFYLIYCMNDEGEKGWYMYDSVEETFQRYLVLAPSVKTDAEIDLESQCAALEKELNTAKMTQYIIIAVAAAIVLILIVVIVVIVLKNRSKQDDFFDEYEDDEDDYDDYYRAEEHVQDDDEEEDLVEKAVEKIVEAESPKAPVSEKDDSDLEFIDFE